MSLHRRVLLYLTVAAIAAIPALAQNPPAGGKPVGANSDVSVPDFSGTWQHPAFPWFEPPASGPGPITNLSRWSEQTTDGAGGSPGLPCPPPASAITINWSAITRIRSCSRGLLRSSKSSANYRAPVSRSPIPPTSAGLTRCPSLTSGPRFWCCRERTRSLSTMVEARAQYA